MIKTKVEVASCNPCVNLIGLDNLFPPMGMVSYFNTTDAILPFHLPVESTSYIPPPYSAENALSDSLIEYLPSVATLHHHSIKILMSLDTTYC